MSKALIGTACFYRSTYGFAWRSLPPEVSFCWVIYRYNYIYINITRSFQLDVVPTCGGHWSVDLASVLLLVEVWVWYGGRSSSTLRRNAIVHLVHWSSLVITGHHWSQGKAHKRLRFPHPMAWHDGMSRSDESYESEIAHRVSQSNPLRAEYGQKSKTTISYYFYICTTSSACNSCSASVTAIPP